MISYSAKFVFNPQDLHLLDTVRSFVDRLPDTEGSHLESSPNHIRCHEVVRAVYKELLQRLEFKDYYFQVHDGKYGCVEHSWITVTRLYDTPYYRFVYILDCYSVGRLPMVQLVDRCVAGTQLMYTADRDLRNDIRWDLINELHAVATFA